jgi:YVTN family beta-propeller protein
MKMTYTPRYNFGHNHMDGTLVIVDTRTNTIDEVVEVGAMPTGIGVRHR